MRIRIWVTEQFVAYHKWENAPEEVSYLRNLHRHLFKVRVELDVYGMDREIEFHTLKSVVRDYCRRNFEEQVVGSCENIASLIKMWIENIYGSDRRVKVEVSEDGENGAIVF